MLTHVTRIPTLTLVVTLLLLAGCGNPSPAATDAQPVAAAATTPTPAPTAAPSPTAEPTTPPTATATAGPSPTATALPLPAGELAMNAPSDPGYLPILMYHYVRTVDPAQDELGYNLSIEPELFAAHVEWLADNGYTTLRMDTLTECVRGLRECPPQSVALTFDDGYEDAYTQAFPVLQAHGFVGTFYVITDRIGQPGYLSWEQIKAMHAAGMEIGSHTVSHPDLSVNDLATVSEQLVTSREVLEAELNAPVLSFCYPFGKYDPATMPALVRDAGYTSAVTTYPGVDLNQLYELPRQRIMGGDGTDALAWYVAAPVEQ